MLVYCLKVERRAEEGRLGKGGGGCREVDSWRAGDLIQMCRIYSGNIQRQNKDDRAIEGINANSPWLRAHDPHTNPIPVG